MYLYEYRNLLEKQEEKRRAIFDTKDNVHEILEEREEVRYVTMMTSVSHTYGNVLAFFQKWVLDNVFPENLFKTIHVNSKIAHRQIRSTSYDMLKKSKPMIIFRPRIADVNEDTFMKGTPIMERSTDVFSTYCNGPLQPFFSDPKNNLAIKYQMNRSVMYVDTIVIFSTLLQQEDYYHYLRNVLRYKHPFFLETCLENYLPKQMLDIISQLSQTPMIDGENSTKSFLEYMNANSDSPITYKLQGASGNKEFYRYYPCNIDTVIESLDKNDGETIGQVKDNYQITFSTRLEFSTTGLYYLFSNHVFELPYPEPYPESTDIIPIFTDVLLREDLNLQFGWHLYNRASYRLETENDEVNIDELLNPSIRKIIDYHLESGILLEDYIDIKIRRQGKRIINGKDYIIDWKTRTIQFISQNLYYTYNIMVCVNVEEINNLTRELFKLDQIVS